MVDFLTPAQRSERMSKIKGRNTRPEILLRQLLHGTGLRYRLHRSELPGKPDLVFPRYKAVVFVHGCFWHRHTGCKIASTPKSNTEFWIQKFKRNVERDAKSVAALENAGWRVFIVWECELSSKNKISSTGLKIAQAIRGLNTTYEEHIPSE